ncbi:replication initiation protein [Tortoise microvirus 8]|nr:replication initiation protein [Tortoise microvirus 8]QCS37472.1 replication initiation protein [Tortoise microvirus 8]
MSTPRGSRFITLTYDDDHLVYYRKRAANGEWLSLQSDGEWQEYLCNYVEALPGLKKSDIQNYMKRLRKKLSIYNRKIRYYVVGEYGTKTNRPHYHLIVFGVNQDDFNLFNSEWYHGSIRYDEVTDASINYILKYHVDRNEHLDIQPVKPFALMSKGIGRVYIDKMKSYHRNSGDMLVTVYGSKKRMPRYYKERMFSSLEREIQCRELQARLDAKPIGTPAQMRAKFSKNAYNSVTYRDKVNHTRKL